MKTIQNLTGPAKPVKENETEVTTYDISQDFPSIKTHLFRARYVNVGPREVVPMYAHKDRPGFIQVVEGEIVEYRSDRTTNTISAGDITLGNN